MKDYPLISIVIPTYNSGSTLSKTLESVKKQKYPKNKIEILIIDGGSTDNTIQIAKRYKTEIIANPKRDLLYGKHIGFLKSKGKYMVSLDSDEVLENPNSFTVRIAAFLKDRRVTMLMSSGLKTPNNYAEINHYINDFGDPFSYFNYGLSHDPRLYRTQLSKMGKIVYENKDYLILDFNRKKNLPIIEPTGASGMIDLDYTKRTFPQLKTDPSDTLLIFYLHNQKGKLLAITKHDAVLHYSSGSIIKYFKKLISRVKNNVYKTEMGMAGFTGRTQLNSSGRIKKYLFIPYSFSILFPLIDTIKFLITRRRFIYCIHPVVCLYISILIVYFMILKTLAIRPRMGTYGN